MTENTGATRSTKVVLIEDDLDVAQDIQSSLLAPGAELSVIHETLLETGIATAKKAGAHAILLDWSLPDGRGLEMLQAVVEALPAAAIVVLGSPESTHETVDAVRLGAQDFLPKASLPPGNLARAVLHSVERKRSEEERAQRASDLQRSSEYKSEFLAQVAHHLQTRLDSLLTLSSLLRDTRSYNLSNEQRKWLSALRRGVEESQEVVGHVLDLSRAEATRAHFSARQAPVQTVLDAIESMFRHVAEAEGVTLRIEAAPDGRETLIPDGFCVTQIIQQLVSNAIRFTAGGAVTVRAEHVRAGGRLPTGDLVANDGVAITVADTGRGFTEEALARLLEFLAKKDDPGVHYESPGIGFAICRRLCDLLGSEIRARSRIGAGSEFTLFLTTIDGDVRQSRPDEATTGSITISFRMITRGRRAFIVDPDMRTVYQLTSALEKFGMEVTAAASPEKSFDSPELVRSDIVFIDVSIAEDLEEFFDRLERSSPADRKPRVLGLVTDGKRENWPSRLDARLRKPVQIADVVTALRRAL